MTKIRLFSYQVEIILICVASFDAHAETYLYGSRTDQNLKGGDIDLLIISEKLAFAEKLQLLSVLKEKLGDQKIDLTILKEQDFKKNIFFKQTHKVLLKITSAVPVEVPLK